MKTLGLYWLSTDLRLHDNRNWINACAQVDELLIVYCIDPRLWEVNRYGLNAMSLQRWHFLEQSLQDLNQQLLARGQQLQVMIMDPVEAVLQLLTTQPVSVIFHSRPVGFYERQQLASVKSRLPEVRFEVTDTRTLFKAEQLPFPLERCPASFTAFRHTVEQLVIDAPLPAPSQLPPPPGAPKTANPGTFVPRLTSASPAVPVFLGGETAGLQQLKAYFSRHSASHYKETRNALDGWDQSTKLSPWLAHGNLSAREVLARLKAYEQTAGANESSYWIYFELLWRDYFQWYALCHGRRLFAFKGIKPGRPLTSFYAERFQRWCKGATPYPLVNACMKQLNATGYLSNRGRQVVASCFVHELSLDWRYGAAYFEQQLLDYDVACNWGNWQYLAGVGADPRGLRHFDIDKQTRQYDPDGRFINAWAGDSHPAAIDSVDAADWPVAGAPWILPA